VRLLSFLGGSFFIFKTGVTSLTANVLTYVADNLVISSNEVLTFVSFFSFYWNLGVPWKA